jgi:CheY-like chemotaxis protein
MVVDDDADVREMIAIALDVNGWRAVAVADGQEALDRLRVDPPPSLILLDLMMPRLNGVELIQRLRADPRLSAIPIVVLSGDRDARRQADALGARGFLAKPVELEALLAAVAGAS